MHKLWKQALAAATLAATLLGGTVAQAAYLIAPGDVVEISVAGLPDLKQRAVVDLDGNVTLPLIAPVKIGGLDLVDAQSLVKQMLSQKLYQQRGPDGRESVVAISPDAVLLAIAEYRPVYLTGDVTKPGEQSFRPGLTVRQAVALAGGYEIMRFRMNNPFLESADLRSDYELAWTKYVKEQGRIWRLKTELDGSAPQTLEQATQAPLPKKELDELRAEAKQQMELSISRMQAEHVFLQGAVKVSNDQLDLLKARQSKEDENVEVDRGEYMKLKDFSEHGNLPIMRLAEVRRLYLFSATQALQTSVQLTNTTRERDDYARKIKRLEEDRRSELLKQLEDATINLGQARSRLQAIGDKITYTGMIRSQLVRTGSAPPMIHIIRAPANGGATELATQDTEVKPGDTVEVALHTEVPSSLTTN